MVEYSLLNKYILSMANSGTTVKSFHRTIEESCLMDGRSFGLDYNTFLKACDGYQDNLSIDYKQAFTCTNCGISPRYFVGDGKILAPLKRKLKDLNLSEFGPHPEDKQSLEQGSYHKQRVFIGEKKERDEFFKLLNGKKSLQELCSEKKVKSANGKAIMNVLNRLNTSHDSLPDHYHDLLDEFCKNVPVPGIYQVTGKKALNLLEKFCLQQD